MSLRGLTLDALSMSADERKSSGDEEASATAVIQNPLAGRALYRQRHKIEEHVRQAQGLAAHPYTLHDAAARTPSFSPQYVSPQRPSSGSINEVLSLTRPATFYGLRVRRPLFGFSRRQSSSPFATDVAWLRYDRRPRCHSHRLSQSAVSQNPSTRQVGIFLKFGTRSLMPPG